MKTRNFKIPLLTLAAVAGSVLLAGDIVAQDATAVSQPTTAVQSMPRFSYGSAQILQMVQAKVGESTVLSYIHNSSMYFPLDAAQIIYLKQQGASNAILDAMLNHQPVASAPAGQASTAAAQDYSATAQTSTAVAQPSTAAPSVTYVQSTPSPVYVSSYPYYYPYYGYYPYYSPISLSFGFGGYYGGGYYGGGYYRGGYYGGWHGGSGGWHGGGGGGWHH